MILCYRHLCGEDCEEHGDFVPPSIPLECNYGDPECPCLEDAEELDDNGLKQSKPCAHAEGLYVRPEHVEHAIGRRVTRVLNDLIGSMAQRANSRQDGEETPCTVAGQQELTVDLFGALKTLNEARKTWSPPPTK